MNKDDDLECQNPRLPYTFIERKLDEDLCHISLWRSKTTCPNPSEQNGSEVGRGVESEDYFRQLNRGSGDGDGALQRSVGRLGRAENGDWTAKERRGRKRQRAAPALEIYFTFRTTKGPPYSLVFPTLPLSSPPRPWSVPLPPPVN